jgi:hypothetical protein
MALSRFVDKVWGGFGSLSWSVEEMGRCLLAKFRRVECFMVLGVHIQFLEKMEHRVKILHPDKYLGPGERWAMRSDA